MTYAPVSCFRSANAAKLLNRRSLVRLGTAAAATGFLAGTGSGRAIARQTESLSAPEPFDGDTFVGETSSPGLFVALVIGSDEARAYLCNGVSLVAWLTGPADSSSNLRMTATSGAELTAASIAGTKRGEATLPDGQTVTFSATPATGIGGLYEIVVRDSRVMGAAAGDRRLDGIVAGSLPDGTLLIAGAISLPDGGLRPLAVFSTPDAAGEQRWIVLEDGRVTGAARPGRGSGFIDPTTDLFMPTEEIYGNIVSPRD